MRIGFHVSISGKLFQAIERAERVNCQTIQIFSRNPRGWQLSRVTKDEIEEFKRKRRKAGISPLYVHIPYLINLASPDRKIWEKSIKFFIEDLKYSELIGADFLITHIGSHKGKGEEFGKERFTQGLNIAIEKVKPQIEILLENTAGQGNSLGYNFRQIKKIRDKIENKKMIGLCFDTAHTFAAGYEINTNDGLDRLLMELTELELIDELKLIHLNDSKTDLASRIDRHEHIGEGEIGLDGFKLILNHPRLKKLNFIMETPRKTAEDDLRNLETVLKLITPACRQTTLSVAGRDLTDF